MLSVSDLLTVFTDVLLRKERDPRLLPERPQAENFAAQRRHGSDEWRLKRTGQDLWLCRFPSFDVLLFRNLTPQDCEMRVVEKLAKTFDKMVVSPTRPVDGPLKRQKPLEDDWGKLDVICCRC